MGGPQRRAGIPPTVRALRLHPFQGLGRPYYSVSLRSRYFRLGLSANASERHAAAILFSYTEFPENRVKDILSGDLTAN